MEQTCRSDRNQKHIKVESKCRLLDNETTSQETHAPTEPKLVYCVQNEKLSRDSI